MSHQVSPVSSFEVIHADLWPAVVVDASELAWRILSRLHGADLIYTPMINANIFNSEHPIYQHEQFDLVSGEEGHTTLDRPLIAQFCSNDKEQFFSSAMYLAEKGVCDAVDLNLGCPQGIAKRGHYGSFLMEDWGLIESLSKWVRALYIYLKLKIRQYIICMSIFLYRLLQSLECMTM